MPVLKVSDLSLSYQTRQGEVKAVQDVSFELLPGQSLGLVGESGCGKSSIAYCLLRLLPDNALVEKGQILFGDQDLLTLPEEEVRGYRWRRISMVFQSAMNVLDPVYRVGQQIVEAMEAHGIEATREGADSRVADLFRMVGLDPQLMERFPHEFSGGMRQRAVIAMALSCDPEVVIADEPTTALDVIVQDRILRELRNIQRERHTAMVYISHDIAVIAEVTDMVAVMYAGRLVEMGRTANVLDSPLHPYTAALMSSFPSIQGEKRPLGILLGEPPSLLNPTLGCPFHPRCYRATEICSSEFPPRTGENGNWVACWHPLDETLDPMDRNND